MLYNAIISGFGITDQVTNSIIFFAVVLLCMAVGYFIGSINPAIIISKNRCRFEKDWNCWKLL